MLPLDYLLALILLTAPPSPAEQQALQALYPVLRLPLQRVGLTEEILDPRELRYILARPEDFLADVELLRNRFHDLADAPMLLDSNRFPDRVTAGSQLAFNRAYRQHLGVRQPLELAHGWEIRTVLQETDYLYQVWDCVREARCEHYYVVVRREALQRLRRLIGAEAYYSGNLPSCVPLWHFQESD